MLQRTYAHTAAAAAHATAAASPRCCRRLAAATSEAPNSSSGRSSGSSIQLQRVLEMQHLLDGAAASGDSGAAGDSAPSSRPGGSSRRGGGFGGASRKQAKGVAAVSADAACPCRSGLSYKRCCQPFLEAGRVAGSAAELVRARLTAAKTGNACFLVGTTHPDSSLLLGGARDAASRAKRMCSGFKVHQLEVVGMAHCAGDLPGSWLVLYVLQATAGSFAGTKLPHMDLLLRGTAVPLADMFDAPGQQQQQEPGGSKQQRQQQPWLFLKRTTQLPDSGDADALVELLQLHVPELLQSPGGQPQTEQQQPHDFAYRQLCFSWAAPWLPAAGGDGGTGSWHLDLLQPAAAFMSHVPGSGDDGPFSGQQQLPSAALLPPGVFVMDEYQQQQQQQQQP